MSFLGNIISDDLGIGDNVLLVIVLQFVKGGGKSFQYFVVVFILFLFGVFISLQYRRVRGGESNYKLIDK